MKNVLLVAAGGAIGSVLRWALSGAVQRWSGSPFPWGTFAVNAIGSFAIGLLAALALERALVSPPVRLFLIVGVLGGFTTFSAFSLELFMLIDRHQGALAFTYAAVSVLAGLSAMFIGVILMRLA